MIFYADPSIIITRNVIEEGYDLEYEQRIAEKTDTSVRYPMYHSKDINAIILTKNMIPEIFEIEQIGSGDYIQYGISMNEGLLICFKEERKARAWFRIFNTDFENLTIEDIRNEYPEEFI